MSIPKPRNKIKTKTDEVTAPVEILPIETVAYTDGGHIEHRSVLKRYFLPIFVVLVSVLSFGVGKLSSQSKTEHVNISYDSSLSSLDMARAINSPLKKTSVKSTTKTNINSSETANVEESIIPLPTNGQVVASSKGTKYHYLYCSGAKTISAKNKIVFKTATEAEVAGYTLAANCKAK